MVHKQLLYSLGSPPLSFRSEIYLQFTGEKRDNVTCRCIWIRSCPTSAATSWSFRWSSCQAHLTSRVRRSIQVAQHCHLVTTLCNCTHVAEYCHLNINARNLWAGMWRDFLMGGWLIVFAFQLPFIIQYKSYIYFYFFIYCRVSSLANEIILPFY